MKTFSTICVSGRSDLEARDASAYHEFYEFIFRSISNSEKSIDHSIEEPIFLTRRQRNFSPITASIVERSFSRRDLVIFDFYNFGTQYDLSYPIVEEILAYSEKHPKTKVLILLKFLPRTDHIADAIEHKVQQGIFHVLDRQGRIHSASLDSDDFDALEYSRLAEGLLEDNESRIRTRTIRHIGHYKRYSGDSPHSCTQFFFDGSKVVDELASAVSESFAEEYLTEGIRSVITVAPAGNWLHLVGETLGNIFERAHISTIDANHFKEMGGVAATSSLVLFAMCDTGQTMRDFIAAIQESPTEQSDIHFASIFSTTGKEKFQGHTQLRTDEKGIVRVKYVQLVEQRTRKPQSCRMCQSGVRDYLAEHDNQLKLSPEEFWTMAFEAGFVVEKDVPDYRRQSLGFLPNFEKMSINNGPYIAHKILSRLSQIPGNLPPEPVLLCPEESGATELARSMSRIGGWNIILVPRAAIRKFEEGTISNEALNAEAFSEEYWFKQVFELSRNSLEVQPIIFDEFDVSGSTFRGLSNLLVSLDMSAWCGLSFISFRKELETVGDLEIYNCYQIGAA